MEVVEKNNLGFVYQLYLHLSKFNLSYIYKGEFSASLNDTILALAEANMQIVNEPDAMKKKVFFIMVESLQNITRHSETSEKVEKENSGLFIIQRKKKDYYITSGNLIDNGKVPSLKEKLQLVNSLDQDSLKNYYREVLEMGEMSDKGGAGLGLIEMARKSGNKLAFDFSNVDEKKSFFYFQSKVSLDPAHGVSAETEKNILSTAKSFHQIVLQKNLNFVFQGDFNHENMKTVLAMTEGNMGSGSHLVFRKRVINLIVELIQNIYKHANNEERLKSTRSGVFAIERHEEKYVLISGNLIHNSKIFALKSKLDVINECNPAELNELFNKFLMSDERADYRGAGLGLIDMKLKSKHNINYHFETINLDYSFFTLEVKIENSNN